MDEPEVDPEQEQKKLDDLGKRIAHARTEINEEDPTTEDRPTFAESGRTGDQDDQTIAPPG